jgi:riboflavin kinase/FMN adenylyltransferase
MKIDEELACFSSKRESILTIGVFDGVHLGHRYLISSLVDQSRHTGRQSGVLTFRNHPRSILDPNFKPSYITTLSQRIDLIKQLGVDFVIPVSFNSQLSTLQAREFAFKLTSILNLKEMIFGPDFAMGHQREGNSKILSTIGDELGFNIMVIDPLTDNQGSAIKSTTIRQAIFDGNVMDAGKLLGRNFNINGEVIKGFGRGEPMGFPTANIKSAPETIIPGDGIYATWATVEGQRYMSATSIGIRPTFDASDRTIETFIMDFNGKLYGKQLGLDFVSRIRNEVKFPSIEVLKNQISQDIEETKKILTSLQ